LVSQWRLILREYLEKNPGEKKVVASKTGASVRSIDRWIEDGSKTDPERPRIPILANAVPGRESEMRLSLEHDYPAAFKRASKQEIMSNIPSPFYARSLEALATTARNLARPTIMKSVLKQLAGHLDPDEEGLMILFAQCVKPIEPDGKITSLIVLPGHGTNKWQHQQIAQPFMAGAGSLCATAVVRGDMALYPQDIIKVNNDAPLLSKDELHSCAAFPVLREGDVAGALFVGAALPKFFTDARRKLIVDYSYSFALALRDHEFYPIDQIDLNTMPSLTHQSEIYRHSQRFLEDLAQQYPADTLSQLEDRARELAQQIFQELSGRKDSLYAD